MSDLSVKSADEPRILANPSDIVRKVAWRLMPLIMLC